MFRGHSQRSIDPKGRLMLPPDFRDRIMEKSPDGNIMITNFDGCVVAYPFSEWEEIEKSFNKLNMANRKFRDFHRFFISGASLITLDKQGRILIPPYLRSYAEISKEVVLAGVGRKFEIWALPRFEEQRRKMEQDFDGIMDSLAENGFELRF